MVFRKKVKVTMCITYPAPNSRLTQKLAAQLSRRVDHKCIFCCVPQSKQNKRHFHVMCWQGQAELLLSCSGLASSEGKGGCRARPSGGINIHSQSALIHRCLHFRLKVVLSWFLYINMTAAVLCGGDFLLLCVYGLDSRVSGECRVQRWTWFRKPWCAHTCRCSLAYS